MTEPIQLGEPLNRRRWLRNLMATGAAATLAGNALADQPTELARIIKNGRLKQSLASWCFMGQGERWSLDRLCQIARQLGCESVELLGPDSFATLRKHGLVCAITSNGVGFMRGLNNLKFHEENITKTKKAIDACAEAKFPTVIGFVGYKWRDPNNPKSGEISREEAFENCVRGLREIMPHAEKMGINICIEHLNSRDGSHPMKGHPGYQGDDIDFVASIIRRVGSPRLKVLFDIYHVQIMHGDLIRRIEQNRDIIGHIHTAGNPGRNELDDRQEINYPPVMRKLVEINYTGYIGHEFIPTRPPLEGIRQAMRLCDV